MLEGSLNCLVLEKYIPKEYLERDSRLHLEVLAPSPTVQQVQYAPNRPVIRCQLKGHAGVGEDFQLLLQLLVLDTVRTGSTKAGWLNQTIKLIVILGSIQAM